MKKILSLSLMAVAMLISGNAKAVNVSTEQALRSAIDNAAVGATVDITLSSDIKLSSTLQIYAKKAETGKTINLDLNGKTLSNNGDIILIELFKGTLNISNGTISSNATKKDAIVVYGIYEDCANWSTLNVAKDAKIVSSTYNAITVMEFWGVQRYANADQDFADNLCDGQGSNHAPTDEALAAYYFAKNKPYSKEPGAYSKRCGLTDPIALAKDGKIDYTSSYPYYGTTIKTTADTKAGYRNYIAAGAYAKANGVIVNVSGYVYGLKYGIKVNGTLRHESTYQPQINVLPSAEIAVSPEPNETLAGKESIGVYCSGAATYNLSGYIHGSIGVVIKSGDVTIENATIVSDDHTFQEIADMPGSGVDGGRGNGVVVYTDGGDVSKNSGYAGGQNVVIKGDTKISSEAGFALVEFTNPDQDSKVTGVDIEGGTFEAGEQGVMAFTQQSVESEKVKVVGGNIGEGAIYKGATQIELTDIIDKETSHYVTEIEVDGEKTFVVNSGTEPETKAFDEIPANGSAVVAAGTATLSADKKFGDLQFTNATVITIANNAVMEVEKIVMGAEAQIIVTPGAKLVVTGKAGIYAPVDENLVIKADETGMGMFLLDPIVSSNRTPHATVEVYADEAYAFGNEVGYGFEIIVCPFSSVSEITYELDANKTAEGEGGAWSSMQIWKNNSWVGVTRAQAAQQLTAFQPIAMTSSAAPAKGGVIKYTFKGVLQGNISGIMPVGKNYNYMGNAYLAPMSSEKFIEQLKATDILENNMWFWKEQGFLPVTADEVLSAGNIAPMSMFILKSKGSVNYQMDYETLIWNLHKPAEK